ncbi:DUF5954 family protein [Streptomyces sp. NBC_01022]|uniref:DUF5954 family protein n=1 Tax=Streptomyces sp. NBC_01022 TaxID=2903723 RepID=UPI002DD8ACD5|nr:DUF5954 family protein [Streptomyces sp. NBC_01022]WRZ79496.1 DUF5954 family protein [Streptomyces sp. NBC_01022]WRZ86179.1 DUF5954 family protein [Streptomyces sp. NBC_01022]
MAVWVPLEPVEATMEADAVDAAVRGLSVAVRGPLFGVASQSEGDGRRWRVVIEVTHGCPQQARDALNSALWFKAKDEAQDRAERRALLAAVGRLETEEVTELAVLDTRYRVVRAEEYAGMEANGDLELPRPTDPEPLTPDWSYNTGPSPRIDVGLVLDPDAPLTPALAVERLSQRSLAYTGDRYPATVLRDSARAVETHPDVLLMPTGFAVVERSGSGGWTVGGALQASAHDARRALNASLIMWEPRLRGLIPLGASVDVDAHTIIAEGANPAAEELAPLAEASDRLRAGMLNQVEADGTTYHIARIRRLLRWGPDGPEPPRPSDTSSHAPETFHPRLDEDGTVHYE